MKIMMVFDHDEIKKEIPYDLICETHEGGRWNTFRRKRLWNDMFTEKEQKACGRLFRQAKSWSLVKGAPESLMLTADTLLLWKKLGNFCAVI